MPAFAFRPRWLAALLAAAVTLQTGCATAPPSIPGSEHQTGLGAVVVVAGQGTPEVRFEGFSRGRGAGALAAADTTFVTCLSALGGGSCQGSACGGLVLFWLAFCGVASAVGGVVGAVTAPSADAVREAEATLGAGVQGQALQESLRSQIETAARGAGTPLVPMPAEFVRQAVSSGDYRLLAAAGGDSVLEATITRAGTRGGGINAPTQGYLESRVRLLRAADGRELFAADYSYLGPRRTLGEWALRDGRALRDAFAAGYAALGTHIHDQVFLLYPLPDQGVHTVGTLASAVGLAPLAPALRGMYTEEPVFGRVFEWLAVESLRPTLRWQSFPRESDRQAAPATMARVAKVRYDLLLAREEAGEPGPVIYRRQGLPDNSHVLETGLAPGQRYFWTVRARFELDGRERVSEWGVTGVSAADSRRLTAPSRHSYRFRTP